MLVARRSAFLLSAEYNGPAIARIRILGPDDRERLEALGQEDTPELRAQCRGDIEDSLERGETWVLEDGGELVASTSFNAVLAEVAQEGGVLGYAGSRREG